MIKKFKGKHIGSNIWYYGYYYAINKKSHYIVNDITQVEVDGETVAQFLNFYDKFNNEIYEKDILRCCVIRGHEKYKNVNINHGVRYLNATVIDILGNIKFDDSEIRALSQPVGKEQTYQQIGYDKNLFNLYFAERIELDCNGKQIMEIKNGISNYKRYYDIEVIGVKDKTSETDNSKYKLINE